MNTPKEIADGIKAASGIARTIPDIYKANPEKACRIALRLTAKIDWKLRLEVVDLLLESYGTEGISGEWQNGYWCNIVAAYCNAGETYATTVLHVRGDSWNPSGKFIISNWGDWFERNQRKFSLV